MANKPVIFLAFANDRVDGARYLRNLPKELDGLRKALYLAQQMNLCEVVERANVTIDQIVNVFQDPRYRDRIAIFHYGGHAHGYQLLLETLDDHNVTAEAGGLVPFFARQQSLQLVFLNGCASRPHALELIEAGIPAVVGTAEVIDDHIATQLSIRFYKGLGNGLPLQRAWTEAEDEVRMSTRKGDYRGLGRKKFSGKDELLRELPWELHQRPGSEQVLDWSLPAACGDPLFGLPDLPADLQPPEEPFLFFKRYERRDAAVFFGRSNYIRDLFNRITDPEAPPLILLYGQSGVGKSSLLDTGLRPRLEHKHQVVYIRRRPEWGLSGTLEKALEEAFLTSGASTAVPKEKDSREKPKFDPLLQRLIGQLDENLQELEDQTDPQFRPYVEQLKAMRQHGSELLKNLQKADINSEQDRQDRHRKLEGIKDSQSILYRWLLAEAQLDRPLVIILDQVEEVFTRPSDDSEELDRFLALVREVFQQPDSLPQGKLMLAYRKEYQPEIEKGCKTYALARSQVFLERLSRPGIMEVVEGLTLTKRLRNWYHLTVEANLPAMIADDLLSDRDSPVAPILQILVTKLWNKAKAKNPAAPEFTVQLYQKLKEEGILLDEFFDQQIAQLAQAMPEAVNSGLLLDLLHYHTTPLGTADSRSLEDIRSYYNHRQEKIDQIVRQCKDLYLLSDSGSKVSLSHDTLAPLVQKAFRESDAPGQRAHRILDNKILDFDPANPGSTLDPVDLELVEKGEPGMRRWIPREREMVRLSRIRRDREEQAKKTRRIIFAAGMLAIAGLGVFSFFQKWEADTQRAEAILQRDSASIQQILADSNRRVAEFQESLAVNNKQLAVYRASQADSSKRIAQSERDNALYQQRIARSEALVNKSRLLMTNDDPDALATASEAWKTFPSDGSHGALLEAYHHSPVPESMATFGGIVNAMAMSPDAAFLAIGTADDSLNLKIFDHQGNLIHTLDEHNRAINDLEFSRSHLASVAHDKALIIRPISNPSEIVRIRLDKMGESVHFTSGGNRVLVISENQGLLFNLDGEPAGSPIELGAPTTAAAVSPDGRLLAIAYPNGVVELRNIADGEIQHNWQAHYSRINALGFSDRGSELFTVSNDSTVVIWNTEGDTLRSLKGHQKLVHHALFFDRDRYLASASADRTIRIWDVENGQLLLPLLGQFDSVSELLVSADAQQLYSADSDKSLNVWKLKKRHQQVLSQSMKSVISAAFLGRNDRILIGAQERQPAWWNGSNRYQLSKVKLQGPVSSLGVSPDGKSAVCASADGEVYLWPSADQDPVALQVGDDLMLEIEDIAISQKWILAGDQQEAFLWQRDGTYRGTLSHAKKRIDAVAISPDERHLLTISNRAETARVWRIGSEEPWREFPLKTPTQTALFLSKSQCLLAGEDGWIYEYDTTREKLERTNMKHSGSIRAMALSPDRNYLAIAGADHRWALWNRRTLTLVFTKEGEGVINDIDFSPDGKYLLTASADGTARLWLIDPDEIMN